MMEPQLSLRFDYLSTFTLSTPSLQCHIKLEHIEATIILICEQRMCNTVDSKHFPYTQNSIFEGLLY